MLQKFILLILFVSYQGFANENYLLAVNKDGNDLSVIDLNTGNVEKNYATGKGPHEVAVTPNNQFAVVTNYGYGCGDSAGRSLTVINLISGETQTIDISPYSAPHGIKAFNDNKRFAVSVECSEAMIVVDIEKESIVQHIPTHAKVSHMVELNQQETMAFTANIGSGSVSVLNLSTSTHVKNIETGKGAEGISLTQDGKSLLVTNRADNSLSVIDLKNLNVVKTLSTDLFPIRTKVSPDNRLVLVSNAQSATVEVFDRKSWVSLSKIKMSESHTVSNESNSNVLTQGAVPIGLVISSDNKSAYVANTNVDEIREIDLSTLKVVRILKAGKRPDGLALVKLDR